VTVRKLTLSAIATSTVLILCGAVLDGVAAGSAAAATTPAAIASPTPTATGTPSAGASTPATLAPAATGTGTAAATVATPAQGTAPAAPAASSVALSSYDPTTGAAVLAPAGAAASSTSTATPSPSPSPATPTTGAAAVQPGQLIDSPPTSAAPHGALVAVTGVQSAADGTVAVSTRPATLPELLGATNTNLQSPVSPSAFQVQPSSSLQVTTNLGLGSGSGSVSGSLGLSASGTVPMPGGSSATLSGSVQLNPTIDFSYQGGLGLIDPQQARVGFDLGAHADWHISGSLTASTSPIKIPLAQLSASPVVMVGPLPVVVNLNFNLYADISADGTVTVDAEQAYDGNWGVHADYLKGSGWTTTTDPGTSTVSPLQLKLSGAASVRAGLLAEGSIYLYDTVGVKASVEPYLRVTANGAVALTGTSPLPAASGTLAVYGGIDINGALSAQLVILGTPVLSADLPFLEFHREWQLTSMSTGQAPAPTMTFTSLDSSAGDDNLSTYLKTQPDWDYGASKSSCPDDSRLIGLSYGSDRGLCTNVTSANLWDAGRAYTVVHGESYVSTDWAPGYTKDQCPAGYFVSGFSRNGKAYGVLCAKSSAQLGTATRTVWFNNGDNRASAEGGDFAYGYSKGQCADDEYIAGVAFSQPWFALWESRPYALLCQKLS
jgi:hypothetical protein